MAFDPAAIEAAITNAIVGMIPFFGPAFVAMTPEEKRTFVLQLAEAIARGAAAGVVQGNKGAA